MRTKVILKYGGCAVFGVGMSRLREGVSWGSLAWSKITFGKVPTKKTDPIIPRGL